MKNKIPDKIFVNCFYWSRYAAVALVFFAIGSMLFYQKNLFNEQFYAYSLFVEPMASEPAQLILAGGEIVRLDANTPNINIDAGRNLIIEGKATNKITDPSGLNRLVVPWGKLANLTLPDNTSITVNAGSQLVFRKVLRKREGGFSNRTSLF